ncbi:MAG: N-acetylmuramoyl-L-alanine amidase family protein, partial [Actinomycetota bacterium]
DLCWDLARRLTERLATAGARVRLSRTEAEDPDVSERARRANEFGAELFVSLHLNAHDEPTAEGSSVYFFHASRSGELLAENVQERLVNLGLRDCRTHGCSYPILRETRMPAVIVEPVFITNPDEEKLLLDPPFRHALAEAVFTGIRGFYRR